MTFLPMKDVLVTAQMDKRTYLFSRRYLNGLYREEMSKYFFSSENFVPSLDNYHSIIKELDIQTYSNEIDWLVLFKQFIELRKEFQQSYEPSQKLINFKEEIAKMEIELYESLKYHNYINKIRKINYNLENDFNSLHQIFFFDFIREENDVYDFYNNYFDSENGESNFLRDDELPLKCFIENFDDIKTQFSSNEESKQYLQEIFNYDFKNISSFSQSKNNPLLFFMANLFKYITFFCKMSFWYIKKYSNSSNSSANISNKDEIFSQLFWEEYIKRYESFISSALKINERSENINVCINYLYSLLFNQTVTEKKFNIYKLLLNIWYNEVILPLYYENIFTNNMNIIINKFVKEEIDSFRSFEVIQNTTGMLIGQIASSFLDLDCNENTISYINNTNMPTTFLYNFFSDILCNAFLTQFSERLQYQLISKDTVLSFYENMIKNKPYNLINKTLFKVYQSILLSLRPTLSNELILSYESFSQSQNEYERNKKKILYEENEQIAKAIENEINEIKTLLINTGINVYQMSIENAHNSAELLINSNNCSIMNYMYKLYKIYYEQVYYFDTINNKVEKTIKKKRQPSTSCLIEKGKKRTEEENVNIEDVVMI